MVAALLSTLPRLGDLSRLQRVRCTALSHNLVCLVRIGYEVRSNCDSVTHQIPHASKRLWNTSDDREEPATSTLANEGMAARLDAASLLNKP